MYADLLASQPDFLLTFLFSYLGDGLEGRLKHLRTLIKVGFEKSKPEKLIFSPVPQDQDSAVLLCV